MTAEQLFLAHSKSKLQQMTSHIETCVLRVGQAGGLLRVDNPPTNSIANLILHLTGNVRQWIGSSIGGQPDIRNRDQEFAADITIDTPELLANLSQTMNDALQVLANLPPGRLTDRVQTQDGERSVLEVIYQVVGHFQQHTGQIIFATKQMTGENLNFYAPPKKSS
jgi:uncharacterized damage-inducible protein DinB